MPTEDTPTELMRELASAPATNFHSASSVSLPALSDSLCTVTLFLQDVLTADSIVRYEDWLEHDGLFFVQGKLNLHDLLRIVGSGAAILEATPDDDRVCIGIAPVDRGWYLRFRAERGDAERLPCGRFDITFRGAFASLFRNDIVPRLKCEVFEEPADAYFRRITARTPAHQGPNESSTS